MTHVGGIDVIGLGKDSYKPKKIVLFPLADVGCYLFFSLPIHKYVQ